MISWSNGNEWSILNSLLTHWSRETHICIGNLTINGSDNGLSPGRCQAIILTNAGVLLIGPLGTNFSGILIQTFSFKKMPLKVSSLKWRPFCLGLNVLKSLDLGIYIHPKLIFSSSCQGMPYGIIGLGQRVRFRFMPAGIKPSAEPVFTSHQLDSEECSWKYTWKLELFSMWLSLLQGTNELPLGSEHNGWHFAEDILNSFSTCMDIVVFCFKFHWFFPTNNKAALVQILAWCWIGSKTLYEPMVAHFSDIYVLHGLSELRYWFCWLNYPLKRKIVVTYLHYTN